jgi:CheY-like chemotaxis protein
MLVGESSSFLALLLIISLLLAWLYWREHRHARSMQAFFASVTHELRTPLTSIRCRPKRSPKASRVPSWHAACSRTPIVCSLRSTRRWNWRESKVADRCPSSPFRCTPGCTRARPASRLRTASVWICARTWMPRCRRYSPDAGALQMILRNLVENSVRHAGVAPVSVRLTASQRGDFVVLEYQDNGAGIVGDSTKLGELFARGANSSGAGVGSVSGATIDAAHGWPRDDSIPRRAKAIAANCGFGSVMNAPTRLLLVEDERNVAETLASDCAPKAFRSSARIRWPARARHWRRGSRVGVAGCGLPDGSGFELARVLRERAPRTAIIFLTAHASAEDRIRGLELGADDYVGKPFQFSRTAAAHPQFSQACAGSGARARRNPRSGAHRSRAGGLRALLCQRR